MDGLRQECTDCGFIYDPADHGGVSVFYLDDWQCPKCGAGVDKFDFALELDEDTTGPHTVPSDVLAVTVIEEPEGKDPGLFGIEISRLGLLRTPAGNLVSSPNSALLLHMVRVRRNTRSFMWKTELSSSRVPCAHTFCSRPSVTSSRSTQKSTAIQSRTCFNMTQFSTRPQARGRISSGRGNRLSTSSGEFGPSFDRVWRTAKMDWPLLSTELRPAGIAFPRPGKPSS